MVTAKKLLAALAFCGMIPLASCGDGKPTEGETLEIPYEKLGVAALEERQVPFDIVGGRKPEAPDAFIARLEADGFKVTKEARRDRKYAGVNDNRINKVIITGFSTVEVGAKRNKAWKDSGISESIQATFENGYLKKGTWKITTWFRPPQRNAVIPYADPEMMEIKEDWINGIVAVYGLPPLKGKTIRVGLVESRTRNVRKDDAATKCFEPDGTESQESYCSNGIEVGYEASYELPDNPDVTCWHGACQVTLSYRDGRMEKLQNEFGDAVMRAYIGKFGNPNPPWLSPS
jgi:hypothetical protein